MERLISPKHDIAAHAPSHVALPARQASMRYPNRPSIQLKSGS
jgi:hypothetical protein